MPGEEQPTASPNHEIKTVERSSFVGKDPATQQERTEGQIDKLFGQALKQKAGQREPKRGHEARVKLTTSKIDEYKEGKFGQAFPNAPPQMMVEVERVLNGMPNDDTDEALYSIVPETANQAPPPKQVEVVIGSPQGPQTVHCSPGMEYPHDSSRVTHDKVGIY